MLLELSQVIYAVHDLDVAARRIASYGLTVLEGGGILVWALLIALCLLEAVTSSYLAW